MPDKRTPSRKRKAFVGAPLLVLCVALGNRQVDKQNPPLRVNLCDLYQQPEQYAGQMVEVRASVAGNDLWIDDFEAKPCPSWTPVVAVFPEQVSPRPQFDLVRENRLRHTLRVCERE